MWQFVVPEDEEKLGFDEEAMRVGTYGFDETF